MIDHDPKNPLTPQAEDESTENGPTIDLNVDEYDAVEDLQALADQVAQTAEGAEQQQEGSTQASVALAMAQNKMKELEKAARESADDHHRLLADFVNYRNRVSRAMQMAAVLEERKLLLEFLPVADSFERCLSATYASVEDFQNGAALIYKQLTDALRRAGAEPVALKVGDAFDAQHAEALTTVSQPDLPDGAVAAIFEKGYLHRDQLLRPARVVVNRNAQEESGS
jgi:molecular chaperone GrpE